MGIVHQLFVSLTDEGGAPRDGAPEFLRSFGLYQRRENGSFCFADADEATEAAAQAEMWELPSEHFYQFVVHGEELHDYPGFYLSLDVVEPLLIDGKPNLKALSGVQIAKDFEAEDLWLHTRVRALWERAAIDIRTKQVNSNWYVVESTPELPGVIFIPKPLFVSANIEPAQTYVVQSDGRDCLSYESALFLQRNGICRVTHVDTPSGDYAVRPRYLVSPMLLGEMIKQRILGIAIPLVPLIDIDRGVALERPSGSEDPSNS